MKVKRIIVVYKCAAKAQRLVFDSSGVPVWGDPTMFMELGKKTGQGEKLITVTVRGQAGETVTAKFDASAECVSGNGKAVFEHVPEALKGFFEHKLWKKWYTTA